MLTVKLAKPTKGKVAKIPKVEAPVPPVQEAPKPEPKKRASRAKPKPTKEELLKVLSESCTEMKKLIQELKEDESKLQGMDLKQVHELIKGELANLEEEQKEVDEKIQELLSLPDTSSE